MTEYIITSPEEIAMFKRDPSTGAFIHPGDGTLWGPFNTEGHLARLAMGIGGFYTGQELSPDEQETDCAPEYWSDERINALLDL